MAEFLSSMTWPFLACLVLTGIHVYLGIHVLERKVIFVDLALAQIAAFGALWGVLLGWSSAEHPWVVKGFSLLFTSVGAAVFALTRTREERVPHEAIIGITYAVALAAAILASSHLAHGAEEMRELLAGSILWVRPDTVVATALLYAVLGVFHYAFRRRFFEISLDPDGARRAGVPVRLWDFLFYFTFGFVVTSSVAIAGVLLVFAYLIIPAVAAVLFFRGVRARLLAGWTIGTLVSAGALAFSYGRDLPSGPTIVVAFGALLVVAGAAHHVIAAPVKGPALARVLGGAAVLLALFQGTLLLRHDEHVGFLHALESPRVEERRAALAQVTVGDERWPLVAEHAEALLADPEADLRERFIELVEAHDAAELVHSVAEALDDEDDLVREAALRCVRALGDASCGPALLAALAVEPDEYLAVEMAEGLLELGEPRGLPALIDVMDHGEAEQARRDAFEHLHVHTRLEFPYDAAADPESDANDAEVERFRAWWRESAGALAWERETGLYRAL